jgi:hypothetical protein
MITMKALQRFIKDDMHGVHYAVSIFIATAVLWFLVHELAETDPIWAISSMVATSDPSMKQAWLTFRSRIINALVGCAVGLLFIAIGGTRLIMLPLAIAVTVLLSSYVVRIQTRWRQAPISVAFVIAAGLEYHSRKRGLTAGVGAHERGAVRLCGRTSNCMARVGGLPNAGPCACRTACDQMKWRHCSGPTGSPQHGSAARAKGSRLGGFAAADQVILTGDRLAVRHTGATLAIQPSAVGHVLDHAQEVPCWRASRQIQSAVPTNYWCRPVSQHS